MDYARTELVDRILRIDWPPWGRCFVRTIEKEASVQIWSRLTAWLHLTICCGFVPVPVLPRF